MSAQSVLAGLYPSVDSEKCPDEILCQPIPIHTIPWNMDYVLTTGKHCPKYEHAVQQYIKNCPEVQRIYTEHADLFVHWAHESGANVSSTADVFQLYNTIITEKEHNKK